MITLKFPITIANSAQEEEILALQKAQNRVYNRAYKLAAKGLSQIEIRNKLKDYKPRTKNLSTMDSWFVQSMVVKARGDVESEKELIKLAGVAGSGVHKNNCPEPGKRIFGGKYLFKQRCRKEITKEEFRQQRMQPIFLIGEAPKNGNRKFEFFPDHIRFKPSKGQVITICLPEKGLRGTFGHYYEDLVALSLKNCPLAVTVSLSKEWIWIAFDDSCPEIRDLAEEKLRRGGLALSSHRVSSKETDGRLKLKQPKHTVKSVKGRFAGFDINPNWVGASFFDENGELLTTRLYDLSLINALPGETGAQKRYRADKLRHEVREVAWDLNHICNELQIEYKFIEDLSFSQGDKGKGADYNRLTISQFLYKEFFRILQKPRNSKVKALNAMYSSTIGNLLHPEFPDAVAASMEIARRGIECRVVSRQKDSEEASKFFPPLLGSNQKSFTQKLYSTNLWSGEKQREALNTLSELSSWKEIHNFLLKTGLRYRCPLDPGDPRFRLDRQQFKDSVKSKVYTFIPYFTDSYHLLS